MKNEHGYYHVVDRLVFSEGYYVAVEPENWAMTETGSSFLRRMFAAS